MRLHRAFAVCVAAALTVTACGDDEPVLDPSASAQEPADDGSDQAPDVTVEGPVSTLSSEIPEEYLVGIGPVDVTGDHLAVYPEQGVPPGGLDPAVGMMAPTLVGLDIDGDPIRIDPATDGPTMLVFLAHWCSHCNNEVPRLNELRDAGRFPEDLNIVGVLTGSSPQAPNWPPTEWIDETMGWTYPTLLDGIDLETESFIAYDAYGVGGFPFTVLVGEDGAVATRWSGEREPDEVIDAISASLGL